MSQLYPNKLAVERLIDNIHDTAWDSIADNDYSPVTLLYTNSYSKQQRLKLCIKDNKTGINYEVFDIRVPDDEDALTKLIATFITAKAVPLPPPLLKQ